MTPFHLFGLCRADGKPAFYLTLYQFCIYIVFCFRHFTGSAAIYHLSFLSMTLSSSSFGASSILSDQLLAGLPDMTTEPSGSPTTSMSPMTLEPSSMTPLADTPHYPATGYFLPGNPLPYLAPSATHQPELLLLAWMLSTLNTIVTGVQHHPLVSDPVLLPSSFTTPYTPPGTGHYPTTALQRQNHAIQLFRPHSPLPGSGQCTIQPTFQVPARSM